MEYLQISTARILGIINYTTKRRWYEKCNRFDLNI